MYHKMLPLKVPWYVLRVNKAEHAVQSYAAGIGARGPESQGAILNAKVELHCLLE